MTVIADLRAILTADISGFSQGIGQAAVGTDGLARAWTKAGSDIASAASRITVVTGTMVGAVVGYTARMGVAFNSMREDATADFTVMLQSAEKAKEMMDNIQSFAAKTPLESGDILQAAKTLLQFGIAGDSVMPMLKQLGDASGGNAERFKAMALAYGQASASGRLMGQDLLQMINAGFNPLQEIAKRTGESMETLKDRMSKGGVSIEEVNQAFKDATSEGGRFFNLMDVKSSTLSGLWSTLIDNIKQTSGKIFEPLSDGLKDFIAKAVAAFDGGSFNATIYQLQDGVASIVRAFQQIATTNGPTILKAIADGFLFLADSTVKLTQYLNANGAAIMQTASSFAGLLKPIMIFLANHPQLLAAIVALRVSGMLGLNQAIISLGSALFSTIGAFSGFASAAGTAATAATSAATATAGAGTAAAGAATSMSMIGTLGIAALIVAVAVAAHYAATEISGWGEDSRKAATEMKAAVDQAERLDAISSAKRGYKSQQGRDAVAREDDPDLKRQLLAKQLAEADKLAKGHASSAAGAQKNADNLSSQWGGSFSLVANGAQKEAAEANELAIQSEREVQRLKYEIAKFDEDTAAAELKSKKKAEAESLGITAEQMTQLEKMRDFLGQPDVTGKQAAKYAGKVEGVTPEMATQLGADFAASDKTKAAVDEIALRLMQSVNAAKTASDANGGTGTGGTGGGSRKAIDKSLAQHRNEAKDAEFKGAGYDKIRDFMGLGKNVTGKDVGELAGGMKGVSPQLAAEMARLFDESDRTAEALDDLAEHFAMAVKGEADLAKRTDKARDSLESMNERLLDLHGNIPDDQLKGFTDHFNQIQKEFVAGAIDADQYRDSLKNLNARMSDAGKAQAATNGLHEDVKQHGEDLQKHEFGSHSQKGLTGKTATDANAKLGSIDAEGKKLADSFQAGTISAAKFSQEMARLKKATDDVTDAAIKEETEKRKQALLRGDFAGAGLDFGKAVQDKVADQQMQQFDSAVTDFVNQFFPLAQITQTVNDGFSNLTDGMGKFGDSLKKGEHSAGGEGGGGGGQDAQAAFAAIAAFSNSIAGRIDNFRNQIQLDMQALEFISDPQERQQMLNQITQLNRNIAQLNNTAMTFSGQRSNDPIFRDPGITGGGQQYTIHNNINIPNVYSFSQSEMDHLANSLANTFSRQGHPAFQ